VVGETLDGKYRIDRQLGSGGMGNVYLATHLGTTRVVAVKVIAPRWAADPQFFGRFQREAQACGSLRHPNIVNVTDFGIAVVGRRQIPYLVMELLDGETLSAFQQAHPRPALSLVAELLDQVSLALDEAHRHGIVHRDLKPDNLWLEPNGRGGYTVKVLDFGVAKMKLPEDLQPGDPRTVPAEHAPLQPAAEMETIAMVSGSGPASFTKSTPAQETETVAMTGARSNPSSGDLSSDGGRTMPGSLVGTPAYMSPEQALGEEANFRSDIYSLAVVAYGLVCGRLPFTGGTGELLRFHREGSPPPPAEVAGAPRDVSDAILSGLARDPTARPSSALEFARRFHNAVDAEFFALRRSRSFLMQHFGAFAVLLIPIYGILLSTIALVDYFGKKLLPAAVPRGVVLPIVAAGLLVLSDNVVRAAAALIALDEKVRVRRFLSFRVFWKLVKAGRSLIATQARSLLLFGPGWLVRDCLWPVVCVVENLSGKAAILRSRQLMTGLNSPGRALAIRHLAVAALAIGEVVQSLGPLMRTGRGGSSVVSAIWFPVFAVFAAAPLFLYDRTAAQKEGPLLQLDRTPEIRTTARPLSLSSLIWLALGVMYLLYLPIRAWIFGAR
jgi:serine/threonine protein kinase